MFTKTKHKIECLQSQVEWLENERKEQRDRIFRLEADLSLLADHMGVAFENIHTRRLVKMTS